MMKRYLLTLSLYCYFGLSFAGDMSWVYTKESDNCPGENPDIDTLAYCFKQDSRKLEHLIIYKSLHNFYLQEQWKYKKKEIHQSCDYEGKTLGKNNNSYDYSYYACLRDKYSQLNRHIPLSDSVKGHKNVL